VFTVLRTPDSALTALEPVPGLISEFYPRAFLRIDPNWVSLRANPRFERLIAEPAAGERPTP
jgi:hypothetical protein